MITCVLRDLMQLVEGNLHRCTSARHGVDRDHYFNFLSKGSLFLISFYMCVCSTDVLGDIT